MTTTVLRDELNKSADRYVSATSRDSVNLQRSPRHPAGLKGPTSKGKEWRGREWEWERKGPKGRGRKGVRL